MQALQISIPKPCHEDWNKMTAAEQGKFCGACQKTVVDFSTMSDGEIVRLFEQKKGKLCGRFATTQLERPIEPTKVYKTNWFKWVMQLLVPMALFSKSSFGQKKTPKLTTTTTNENRPVIVGKYITRFEPKKDTLNEPKITIVSGQIVDEENQPIPYASIIIEQTKIGVVSDTNGHFKISVPVEKLKSNLQFSSVGFEKKSIPLKDFLADKNKKITLTMYGEIMGDVKVLVYPVIKCKKLYPTISTILIGDTNAKKVDTSFHTLPKLPNSKTEIIQSTEFTVFPNPIPSGEILNISATVKKAGVYYLELISTNGELMVAKEVKLATTNEKVELQTNDVWAAGTYFLRILDADKKFVFNSKVVIL